MSSGYPQRPSHFAHRFCRLLTKAAVAQHVGPEVCWLLTVIVHQEDAKRYRGPVTYFNEQLMPLCGFGGRRRLVLARDKAREAGWLHYEEGGKGRPGRYWVSIPTEFTDLPDTACDEKDREECRSEMERKAARKADCRSDMEHQPERQADSNRNGKRAPFIPTPNPTPVNKRARTAEPSKQFNPPTLEDVTAYCRERQNKVDPVKWLNHYQANGWRVGRNPMRDWKAAVRTWEANGVENNGCPRRGPKVDDGSTHPQDAANRATSIF